MAMIARLLIFFLITFAAVSCRTNNGDIGFLFGSWLLEDMTVDGETPAGFNPEETFWSFQNNIIRVSRVGFMYERDDRWGTWAEEDDCLILNFTHHDNTSLPGTYPYSAPEWLGWPSNTLIQLEYISNSSSRMVLKWQGGNGENYTYSLRKIW